MKILANWVRGANAGKLESIGQYQKPLTEVEAELSRVNRELAEVKMERSRVGGVHFIPQSSCQCDARLQTLSECGRYDLLHRADASHLRNPERKLPTSEAAHGLAVMGCP
jgi:hypothetical protein